MSESSEPVWASETEIQEQWHEQTRPYVDEVWQAYWAYMRFRYGDKEREVGRDPRD